MMAEISYESMLYELQSILKDWSPVRYTNCSCPHENEVIHTIIARNGDEFYDSVSMDVLHLDYCPYARIAKLIGESNIQHWQEDNLINKPLITRLGE